MFISPLQTSVTQTLRAYVCMYVCECVIFPTFCCGLISYEGSASSVFCVRCTGWDQVVQIATMIDWMMNGWLRALQSTSQDLFFERVTSHEAQRKSVWQCACGYRGHRGIDNVNEDVKVDHLSRYNNHISGCSVAQFMKHKNAPHTYVFKKGARWPREHADAALINVAK
jgi:hypothetical protein